ETGPGVYEAAILFSEALEAADRAILFKTGAKEIGSRFGIMPSFMAKWSPQYPGCSGHIHQSLSDGKKNLFHDAKNKNGMSRLFESYLAGQLACLLEFAPMYWPTVNSYKRLVDGFWAPVKPTWGLDNRPASFRVLATSPKSTRLVRRRLRRSLRRDARVGMAAIARCGNRLGIETVFRDHMMQAMRHAAIRSTPARRSPSIAIGILLIAGCLGACPLAAKTLRFA